MHKLSLCSKANLKKSFKDIPIVHVWANQIIFFVSRRDLHLDGLVVSTTTAATQQHDPWAKANRQGSQRDYREKLFGILLNDLLITKVKCYVKMQTSVFESGFGA